MPVGLVIDAHGRVICADGDELRIVEQASSSERSHRISLLKEGRPSSPLLLDDGTVVLTAGRHLISVSDLNGLTSVTVPELLFDDSGHSPNTLTGSDVIVTAQTGEVFRYDGESLQEIGIFGYDLIPPAIYPNGDLSIASYANDQILRVTPEGSLVWSIEMDDPDCTVAIDERGTAFCASTGGGAVLVASDGQLLRHWDEWAKAACHPSGWALVTRKEILILNETGEELRSERLRLEPAFDTRGSADRGIHDPLVTSDGSVYFSTSRGVTRFCYDTSTFDHWAVDGVRAFCLSKEWGLTIVADDGLLVAS